MRSPAYPSYRPTGIEWIGEVPEHWGVASLAVVAEVQISSVDRKSDSEGIAVRFLGTDTVYSHERITNSQDLETATATPRQVTALTLRRGDIVVTKDSLVPTNIAAAALIEESMPDTVCGYHLALVRARADLVHSGYLFHLLRSRPLFSYFVSAARGTTIVGIGRNAISRAPACLPPLLEQRAIATFLDRETTKLDQMAAKVEEAIERLQEYRAALITAAVTGRIDVRGADVPPPSSS